MRNKKFFLWSLAILMHASGYAQQTPMNVFFDTPIASGKQPAWGNNPGAATGSGHGNLDPEWEQKTLPIGNGSIGANIFGSVATEHITFNEKSLWRGGPNTAKGADYYWNVNKNSAHVLKEIRQAFLDKDQAKVTRLTQDNFNSEVPYEADAEDPFRFGSFTSAGTLDIETGIEEQNIGGYSRSLSLDSALVNVCFAQNGVQYKRQYFTSFPDQVMVIRYSASEKGKQNLVFKYTPNPLSKGEYKRSKSGSFCYSAHLNNNDMHYVVRAQAIAQGGKTWTDKEGRIHVEQADEVIFLISADTDYNMNFNPDFKNPKTYVGVKPLETTRNWMDKASEKTFDDLLQRHYQDYAGLFQRTVFEVNPSFNTEVRKLSTPERIARYRTGAPDYELESLYYQFGRYLLISSSRPGDLPANLQGIWHNNIDGPWRIDYHNNINVQMNYWPACPTNLAECEWPLIDFIRTQVKPGERTAKAYLGARG